MLRTIIASSLILAALFYFGCNSESSNITAPEKSFSKVSVPFKAVGSGTMNMATEFCTNPAILRFGRIGAVSGNASHLGKFTGVMKYCVQYTSQAGGNIINPSDLISVFTAANGDELHFKVTSGTFTILDIVVINGVEYTKVYTADGAGIITGGTGRFEGATGNIGPFVSTQYVPLSNPFEPGFGDMNVTGSISY